MGKGIASHVLHHVHLCLFLTQFRMLQLSHPRPFPSTLPSPGWHHRFHKGFLDSRLRTYHLCLDLLLPQVGVKRWCWGTVATLTGPLSSRTPPKPADTSRFSSFKFDPAMPFAGYVH